MGDHDIQQRQLARHRDKLLSAGAADLFLLGDPHRVAEAAQGLKDDKTHEEKMAGLYVDWHEGQLRTPSCFERERAVAAFASATKLLDHLEPILGNLTQEALADARMQDVTLRPVLDRILEEAGVERTTGLAGQLIAWGLGQTDPISVGGPSQPHFETNPE